MASLKFENLLFKIDGEELKVNLLRQFYFKIPVLEVEKIGKFKISEFDKHKLVFEDVQKNKVDNKFNFLIQKYIPCLKNSMYGKDAVYVHKNSGIPLIGSQFFGIIDRNTNCVEIKPITGCNLNCIYCSVDEGMDSKKKVDFVVEKDYIVDELRKLVEQKDCDDIEVHIGTHGEPLLYGGLIGLIKDIKKIKNIIKVSIDTNGTLLTEQIIDDMISAGLDQINISLNAVDSGVAKKIAGMDYNVERVKELIKYAAGQCDVIVAPVLLDEINDDEIEKIIEFVKDIVDGIGVVGEIRAGYSVRVGIQNYLQYKAGRNPTKQLSWDKFKERLLNLEEKHKIKLLFDFKEDFNIHETDKLEKPFKKNQLVKALVVSKGRYKNEMIVAADGRSISVPGCTVAVGRNIKIKIVRDKHNIFIGKMV